MVRIQLVVFTLFFGATIQGAVDDPDFKAHMRRVREFPCKYPRLTAVKTSELTANPVLGKIYIPEVTVLHRCDRGSGCCFGSNMYCGPASDNDVPLKFYVKTIHDGKSVLETITAKNHTKCSCQEIDGVPRR